MGPHAIPGQFVEGRAGATAIWPSADWWNGFGSPELSGLIAEAQANNRDISAAMARVAEAEQQAAIVRASLFPQLNAQAQAQRSNALASGQSGTGSSAPAVAGTTQNSFALTMGATYELDIWGLARANWRAAREAVKSARYAQQSVAMSVVAGVANGYFDVLTLRDRIAIANDNIAAIDGILSIVKLKVSTGTSSDLELAQEEAQLEAVSAQLPALRQQELDARLQLAVLLGRLPERFSVAGQSPAGIRLPDVTPGIPAEVLVRRPDVALAEANLAQAHANLDAARKALLPQFALTGSGGFASATLSTLLHSSAALWTAGAGATQTIFEGGKLIGQKNLAYATQKELIAAYQTAVLNALSDVESALGTVSNDEAQEAHLRREVEAAREAFRISELQYREGAGDLLAVLQAQQTLFEARDQLAQARLARMQAIVHLYEALGGGWREPPQDRTQLRADG